MFKLIHTTPDIHKEYNCTAVEDVTMTISDEASLDEMMQAFRQFLRATGYNVSYEEDY